MTCALDGSGNAVPEDGGIRYKASEVRLERIGDWVYLTADVVYTYNGNEILSGLMTGSGPVHNGFCYVTYKVVDKSGNFYFGFTIIRLTAFGDITGYWFAEYNLKPGTNALGHFRMVRR